MPKHPRSVAIALAVACTVPLAACGGGGDGGGDSSAYAKTYQDACTNLSRAAATYGRSLQSAAQSSGSKPSQDEVLTKVKPVFATFFDTAYKQYESLAKADAPDEFQDFQKQFSTSANKALPAIKKARDVSRTAKTSADLQQASAALAQVGAQDVVPPKKLLDQAPACKAFLSSAAGTSTTGGTSTGGG